MPSRHLHIGCSGWNYLEWRQSVYPEGLPARHWLGYYSQLFNTVEVNSTFYRLASPRAVAAWVKETPADFIFTIKASRYLTHVKRLRDIETGVERFYKAIEPLVESPKLGPVLWQLPANFQRDEERLASVLKLLPTGRHCFEFRHASWFYEPIYKLLRSYKVALVIADHPDRRWQPYEFTTDWSLVRMHYGQRGRRGNYSHTELKEWSQRLMAWHSQQIELFVYFNNDWEGFAPANARALVQLVDGSRR